jgi:hypothetical protein
MVLPRVSSLCARHIVLCRVALMTSGMSLGRSCCGVLWSSTVAGVDCAGTFRGKCRCVFEGNVGVCSEAVMHIGTLLSCERWYSPRKVHLGWLLLTRGKPVILGSHNAPRSTLTLHSHGPGNRAPTQQDHNRQVQAGKQCLHTFHLYTVVTMGGPGQPLATALMACAIGLGTKLTLHTACTLSTCTQWLQRRAWTTISSSP